ncbi:MAG: class I SAM-dependent methyltransferase [Pseudodesulfovibrio sp.]|nr:class I SAM-dependent methyltransferase [Pseudodesulfovibrio sp.]
MDITIIQQTLAKWAKAWRKGTGKKAGQFVRAMSTVFNWMGWGGSKRGFYIPYRWAGHMPIIAENFTYGWLKSAWDTDHSRFEKSLRMIEAHLPRLLEFSTECPGDRDCPRFDQSWCPGLDGAAAYSFVRELKPANIIEIGSGHSTRFMVKAIRDGRLDTCFRSIDPEPRRGIDHLCHEVIRKTMDQVDLQEFSILERNDILFFDGSHIAMPGTDVDYLINGVLPVLNPGVWVHIHDIFLPNGYPDMWQWRGYNEQNMVAALLAGGDRFQVCFASAYVRKFMTNAVDGWSLQMPEQSFETSLWLSVKKS